MLKSGITVDKKYVILNKEVGETPLECLENYRRQNSELTNVPMTYAGRLDPMAEGKLLVLIGEECKNKEKYLVLDKEYEVEIVFGISTDTYDALGLALMGKNGISELNISKYIGKFRQEYPAYSSKTINGIQLHELARKGELPDKMPIKEVEIYSIQELGRNKIASVELKERLITNIKKVNGDFRQEEIKSLWQDVLTDSNREFDWILIRVDCSSGTYMRSLADRIGRDMGTEAFALSIKRTKIGDM